MLKLLAVFCIIFTISNASAKKPEAPVYRADLDLSCKEVRDRDAKAKALIAERNNFFKSQNIPEEKRNDKKLPDSLREKLGTFFDKQQEISKNFDVMATKAFEITGRESKSFLDTMGWYCSHKEFADYKLSDLIMEQVAGKVASQRTLNKVKLDFCSAKLQACQENLAGTLTYDGERWLYNDKKDKNNSSFDTNSDSTKED